MTTQTGTGKYEQLLARCRGLDPVVTAVAHPCEATALAGAMDAAAQGLIGNRSFGQALLLALLVIVGGLFLVIEVVALVVGLALAKSITGSVHQLFTHPLGRM